MHSGHAGREYVMCKWGVCVYKLLCMRVMGVSGCVGVRWGGFGVGGSVNCEMYCLYVQQYQFMRGQNQCARLKSCPVIAALNKSPAG